jgi:ribonucleoside-diphosphate reductase alpha chain
MPNKKYKYDDVLSASREYFFGDDLPAQVFVDKYALKDVGGNYLELTPDDMHDRLASEFARIDKEKYDLNYDERLAVYRDAIDKFARIVPQGSVMSAVGNEHQTMSASNCVVAPPPEDDMGSIMDAGRNLAQLYKRRAGAGIDISNLRPDGERVSNAAKSTSGAWSFADLYSDITGRVCQGGRRGACIVTMSVHHPDAVRFATAKHDKTKIINANISLKLTNEFLEAVENDGLYEMRWPVDSDNPKISKTINAREVWNEIVESATLTADPGLLMWDNVTENLPADFYERFRTHSTNPCSELPLGICDACRLISMNLTGYVKDAFDQDYCHFDFHAFKSDVKTAMQMIDNLVDLEIELIDRIKNLCDSGSNALLDLIRDKDDDEIRKMFGKNADLVAEYKNNPGSSLSEWQLWDKLQESGRLGRRTGLGTHGRGPFPVFDYEIEKECKFIKRLPQSVRRDMREYGRRNISLLTQAPTGSVSIVSKVGEFDRYNVSSGIEPIFRIEYDRFKKVNPNDENVKIDRVDENGVSWQRFDVVHANVISCIEKTGESMDDLPDYFVTSDQIDWQKRVELQGVGQQYIDHAMSSTINLPRGTTTDVVSDIYMHAWKSGLKGITVYVEGSKDGVLVSKDRPAKIVPSEAPKRPLELLCEIHSASVRGVGWTILIGLLDNMPYEMFIGRSEDFDISTKHKTGKIVKAKKKRYNLLSDSNDLLVEDVVRLTDDESAWTTRMMSMALRHGTPVEYIVEQLSKDGSVVDINNVLSRLLRKYIKRRDQKEAEKCPQCGGHDIVYEEGCKRCPCGWTGCS